MKNILVVDANVENSQKLLALFDAKQRFTFTLEETLSKAKKNLTELKINIAIVNANFFTTDRDGIEDFLEYAYANNIKTVMYASQDEYKLLDKSIEFISDVIFKPIRKNDFVLHLNFLYQKLDFNKSRDLFALERMKMEAVGEMISMIAHQWRQPLSVMGSQISQIEIENAMDELNSTSLENVCSTMKNQIDYLSETIDDFRFYFTPSEHTSSTTLHAIVERAQNVISIALAHNRITMIVQEPLLEDSLTLHVNEVVQVVINIINNAMDEMITRTIQSPCIKIYSSKDNDYVHLFISDNAGGIDEKIIHKVFDPYFSTKKKKNGTGLGLYMAKNIIERHCNGYLGVSNSNEGAEFKLSFPIKEQKL